MRSNTKIADLREIIRHLNATITFFTILFSIILSNNAMGAVVKIAFDPSPTESVIGYKLYYGKAESFGSTIDLGLNVNCEIPDLEPGATYYLAAAGYDEKGLESTLSDTIVFQIPVQDSDGDGVSDTDDQCPLDPEKAEPGTCGCGFPDADSDGDGVADCDDLCPDDPNKIEPGTCGCGFPDADSDGDGVADCDDLCPDDPNKIEPGTCGCGFPDADSDGDGVADCDDLCPDDPNKIEPGTCGCGFPDADSDGDGVADCDDLCPDDPNKLDPGTCGCGFPDADSDGDGVADCDDLCPDDPNKLDPGTCGCGVADTDSDEDGIPDCEDSEEDDTQLTQIIQTGELLIDHKWLWVSFEHPFQSAPVVVANIAGYNDPEPTTIRIRNVDQTGFEIRLQEWDYQDGVHDYEAVSYIAMEKGFYVLPGGILVEAGTVQNGRYTSHNVFTQPFNVEPVMIASVTTENELDAVVARIKDVRTDSFKCMLEEQELSYFEHYEKETVSFIAWEPSAGILGSMIFEVDKTDSIVNQNFYHIPCVEKFKEAPLFFAGMQHISSIESSNLRYRNNSSEGVDIMVSEESSQDEELEHANEIVGYIRLEMD